MLNVIARKNRLSMIRHWFALWLFCSPLLAQTTERIEFFETNIRPVLADKCYRCHGENPDELEGGLNLTYKEGLLAGGDRGSALAPGNIQDSLLMAALRYDDDELQMPPTGKLPDKVIANFETWIEMGAPDPRQKPTGTTALNDDVTWEVVLNERKKWWSLQPVKNSEPPAIADAEFGEHPVDRFIAAKWTEAGLTPAPIADPHTLIRRLSYVLIGLPPTPEATQEFAEAAQRDYQAAVESAVDRLLNSPRFGERWARHWMDWIRYAETHGSEGDPLIPNAWRYRDYLIRALNADVPYDQLIREHLAGDLLEDPRLNRELGLNESAIGTCQYRFVQHGYSPTDALDEQVRFTENQIDVISKAFLGLTVACARCHNHKFDAVSQTDFYALYGIMASSRPAVITVDSPERQDTNKQELASLKDQIRRELAKAWLRAVDDVADKLAAEIQERENEEQRAAEGEEEEEEEESEEEEEEEEFNDAAAANYREGKVWRSEQDPLYVWRALQTRSESEFLTVWESLVDEWRASEKRLASLSESASQARWDLTGEDATKWHAHGNGVPPKPCVAGEFTVALEDDQIIRNILPAGVYSHTLSDKHSGVMASPRFMANRSKVFVRVIGDLSVARYVVQNYPLVGETYPVTVLEDGDWRWHEWDAAYWDGDHLHIEVTTAADQPVHEEYIRDRSWFGISQAIVVADGQPEPRDEIAYFIAPIFETDSHQAPKNANALSRRYATALKDCIVSWQDRRMTDAQARFLDFFVREDLLPNNFESLPAVAKLVEKYRILEDEIPIPTRVPAVMECDSFDQPLFVRGSHRKPGEPVKRRFLEAIDSRPYEPVDAGRRELAESIIDAKNPLTARVIANRLWHHTFGQGIVSTPDNFGQLGAKPSHPELLDHLATLFVQEGWSIKKALRYLTTSRTFRLRSSPSAVANRLDPENQFLSHANLRRLEAEAIRESMLMASGLLDLTEFGEPVDREEGRRSVYGHARRNNPDPLLSVFDAPIPTSTKGRRHVTNVPAQALSMMNSEYVHRLARAFAHRVKEEVTSEEDRIILMVTLALGREPSVGELGNAKTFLGVASGPEFKSRNREAFLAATARLRERIQRLDERRREDDLEQEERDELDELREVVEEEIAELKDRENAQDEWYELALAIFSLKEFIYVR